MVVCADCWASPIIKKEIDKSIEVSGKKTSKGESPSSHARRVLMTHFVHQLRPDLGNSVLGDSNISQPRLAKRKPKSLASPSSVSISLTEAQTHIHYAAIPSWLGLKRIRTAHLTTKDNCHCGLCRPKTAKSTDPNSFPVFPALVDTLTQ